MRLINFPWGPYPRRLTHYLAEKGIGDIDLTEVEFPHVAANWPEGFLRDLSPGGTLPVLQTDEGVTIGQSIAILEYLEEKYPTPNLLGSSAEARAATRELVGVIEEATTYLGIWARQGSRVNAQRHKPDAGAATVGAEKYGSKLRLVERMITGDRFLIGDSVTIADCAAMALLQFAEDVYAVSIPKDCVRLAAWYERFLQRPSVPPYVYPPEIISLSYGLPEQSGCTI